jgi:hypothetical protein
MKLEGEYVLLSDKERAIGRENYGKIFFKKIFDTFFIHYYVLCIV